MKFDLHMHTNRHSPDSVLDPFLLVKTAKANGLDGVVITEHDWLWTHDELEELRKAEPSLVILAGVEVTAREGDMLCYGITNPFTLKKGIRWKELCQEVHFQGGACVAAHPYRWSQPFDGIMADGPPIDGMEMMSKNMDKELRFLAKEFADKNPQFAQLGNSDSHDASTLGCNHTIFDTPIRKNEDLVRAIRERKCKAVPGLPK